MIVPISSPQSKKPKDVEQHALVMQRVKEIARLLEDKDIRVKIDEREHMRSGLCMLIIICMFVYIFAIVSILIVCLCVRIICLYGNSYNNAIMIVQVQSSLSGSARVFR